MRAVGSPRLWRLQRMQGSTAKLMDTDRTRSTVRYVPSLAVTVLAKHTLSCYRVYSQGEVVGTIRSFGELPGYGGPLVLTDDREHVFATSNADRVLLHGFSVADHALWCSLGFSQAQIRSLVGGCIPSCMVIKVLAAMLQSLPCSYAAVPLHHILYSPSSQGFPTRRLHNKCCTVQWHRSQSPLVTPVSWQRSPAWIKSR